MNTPQSLLERDGRGCSLGNAPGSVCEPHSQHTASQGQTDKQKLGVGNLVPNSMTVTTGPTHLYPDSNLLFCALRACLPTVLCESHTFPGYLELGLHYLTPRASLTPQP